MGEVVEIWEADPLSGCSCGCIPFRISQVESQRIINEVNERHKILMQLKTDFSELTFEIDVIHPQRPRSSYPDHVRELLNIGARPPFFFLNRKVILQGVFPQYETLKETLAKSLKNYQ